MNNNGPDRAEETGEKVKPLEVVSIHLDPGRDLRGWLAVNPEYEEYNSKKHDISDPAIPRKEITGYTPNWSGTAVKVR